MIERYIKMRNSGQYQINWFYDYYTQNGGDSIGMSKFSMVFNTYNLNEILETLDKKFNLMSILDAKGQLLKVFKYE
jgi:hypothetical protein